ncbi:MAG: serine acetyltransferase [Candidatus Omnitrophica bacterium]|nr:serine acetyltransferase [Candidatus Omnitrophota bacterium]
MFKIIYEDLKRKSVLYYGDCAKKKILRMLITDGSLATITYRMCHLLRKLHLGFLALLLAKINEFFNHLVIGRNASFGPGFVLMHTFGIVINSDVVGGKNITLEHGVTIGSEKGKSPVLADNIFIGAGAKIIGAVKIGNNVNIGANAVVVKDVPNNVTVAGVPAEIVKCYE